MAGSSQFMALIARKLITIDYSILKKIIRKTSTFMNLSKDVIIYENKTRSSKVLSMLGVFGFGQWCMSIYMSQTLLYHMPAFFSWIPPEKNLEGKVDNKLPRADLKYRIGFSFLAALASTGVLGSLVIFNLRSVSSITLLKGGKDVMIKTFTPFGKYFTVICELENISAVQHRTAIVSQIPLKIKGRRFHFLMDKSGEFIQPTLYDKTVGIKRTFT
ncbi:transmembrane protein 223 isoform X2 [Hydra vulgaris]|uniref:Transmembrane protein 223 isoform X2 n=2 Tax=Hydra vulgaris TaxID=6087 RepID=A0ABM4BEZ9_HYDVU